MPTKRVEMDQQLIQTLLRADYKMLTLFHLTCHHLQRLTIEVEQKPTLCWSLPEQQQRFAQPPSLPCTMDICLITEP